MFDHMTTIKTDVQYGEDLTVMAQGKALVKTKYMKIQETQFVGIDGRISWPTCHLEIQNSVIFTFRMLGHGVIPLNFPGDPCRSYKVSTWQIGGTLHQGQPTWKGIGLLNS